MTYQAAQSSCALFEFRDWSFVELHGADARTFLHNLSSNDVKALKPGDGCETFLCNAKARVIALAWVSALADGGLRLDTGPGQAETILKHLDHYLISEQVELTDLTPSLALLRLIGPQAASTVHAATQLDAGELPPLGSQFAEGVQVRKCLSVPGVDVIVANSHVEAMRQKLTEAGAVLSDPGFYEILRVEAGLPVMGQDIDDQRLAMEVGRTAQAISYTKGCYLGQETIVMARDRGHVNRMLLGLRIEGDDPVPAGSVLTAGGLEVGTTTSCVRSPRLGTLALAYVKRGHQLPGTEVQVGTRAARVSPLPFTA